MKKVQSFWQQPSKAYRNFQVMFTLLTLNFVIPAISYAIAPEIAVGQFIQINELLGGAPFSFPEAGSRMWRYLGAANVMTLGLMCFLMQWNLRKYFVLLLPLVFLKAYNSTLFLFGFIASPQVPAFLAIAIFDYITSWAFWHFSRRAYHDIQTRENHALLPQPFGTQHSLAQQSA